MKKVHDDRLQETVYEEVLENGLHVFLIQKKEFVTSTFLFQTHFGALDTRIADAGGNVYSYPYGTAHYLEHKLFESSSRGDVMKEFDDLGANVNAYTSYDQTVYYFTTPDPDIFTPLNLLLDFVQEPAITQESVDREKGIILQERSMYFQDPDSRMFLETMRSLYFHHPLREDITGTKESIEGMQADVLMDAWRRMYAPSCMDLIGVTSMDPEDVMEEIRKNQAKKHFAKQPEYHRCLEKEPPEVCRKWAEISMDVLSMKVTAAYKLPVNEESAQARVRRELALQIAMDAWFTPVSGNYQKWLDEKKISSLFDYDIDLSRDRAILVFQDENVDAKRFYAFVQEQMRELVLHGIKQDQLDQMKKRIAGGILRIFDSPGELGSTFARSILDDVSLSGQLAMCMDLSREEVNRDLKHLDLNHSTCVLLSEMNG